MKRILRLTVPVAILLITLGLSHHAKKSPIDAFSIQRQTAPTVLTIWVHGTSISPIKNLHGCPIGLHAVTSLSKKFHMKKNLTLLCQQDPENFCLDHCYMFGWSGELSYSVREQAADKLYEAIAELVKKHENRDGVTPFVRLVTHSHGGNVALNLARSRKNSVAPLSINELILLACPVQQATLHHAQDPLFKKVYSLYSDMDALQVLDPQGIYKESSPTGQPKPLFSERRFPESANLTQARVKLKGRAPFHAEFIMDYFIQQLPSIRKELATMTPDTSNSKKPLVIRR